jgi:hypothetical protein
MEDIFTQLCLFLAEITNCMYKQVYRIKKKKSICMPNICSNFGELLSKHSASNFTIY